MRAKPENEWTPETVTARDLVQDSNVTACIFCPGCNVTTEINIWKIGRVLADTALQKVRLRCRRCGVYPREVQIKRRTSALGQRLLTIPLKPWCWDEGHDAEQRRALARAQQRRAAQASAPLQGPETADKPEARLATYRCNDRWL